MAAGHWRAVAFLLAALLAVWTDGSRARQPGPGGPARAAGRAGAPELSDTLLARIGTGRDITVSRFMNAWTGLKPPERPDSLTPETAGGFLQLLIGKEALGAAALREHWVWTAQESSEYRALRDRLVLRAVLDSALDASRRWIEAAGDTVPDRDGLGVIARDSLVARLGLAFDAPLLEGLARAFAAIPRPSRDSSLSSQLRVLGAQPRLEDIEPGAAPGDSAAHRERLLGRPIATGRDLRYTVADLLEMWRHMNPLSRPRIETAEQVRDLAGNGIFERELRHEGERRRLADRPDIASALAERREFVAVSHLVAREVYAKIATDSVTLERHYREHIDEWSLPMRVRLTRLVLGDRAAATRMRLALTHAAEAESLAERGERAGAPYRVTLTAEKDSALFARALAAGPSAVLGPDSARGGWTVARVTEIVPARRRTFAEARQLVYHDWHGAEGERLMREFLDRTRRAARVTLHPKALAHLVETERARARPVTATRK